MASTERLLTRREAARRAGVTYNTILLWERAGRLHPATVKSRRGERFLIREAELDAVAAEHAPPFDPSLVWHRDELEAHPVKVEPDPDPEVQPY
jgi:hypothetical protein